ncbi:MAG TPA: Ig-like domain-containing protein, partial [Anaerolineales bacterium]|nr:Ig-like domain-containing protein [Anaerolineales bacterium]
NVVAASATDSADNLPSWSNYGDWVDVSAPGVSIYTTANGGGYRYGSGTSFASPVVAGVAALIFSLNPSLSNAQVVDLLKNNCDDLGAAGFDVYYGSGRVNAARALQAAYSISNLQVEITSPTDGATVTGIANVEVSASSSLSITKVELYVNGALKGAKSSTPYSFAWDTTGLSGSHTLVSRAYDASGTIATSPTETVTVAAADTTPPTVYITGLAYDGRFATVTVYATDASGTAKVEIYVNGKLSGTDTSNPYSFKLNTKPWKKGTYYFQAKAYDVIGNSSTSTSLSLTK